MRRRPSGAIHSLPEAPESSGLEASWPASPSPLAMLAPSSRWLVSWTLALTPLGAPAASASWTAWARGFGGGVGVFFIAMRGGPKGARQALHTDSPAGRRLVGLGIVVLFAAGLAVPALVLAFNGEDKASVAAGGLHLNPAQERGRELFARACAVCHTLHAAKAVGRTGPNLDVRVGEQISTPS